MVPIGTKTQTISFVLASDLPKEDVELMNRWSGIAPGAWKESVTNNNVPMIPVSFVENFYDKVLPFIKEQQAL